MNQAKTDKKSAPELSGYVTLQQIADFLGISDKTLRVKLVPLRPFLQFKKRKRLFSPDEWQFVIQNLDGKKKPTA